MTQKILLLQTSLSYKNYKFASSECAPPNVKI